MLPSVRSGRFLLDVITKEMKTEQLHLIDAVVCNPLPRSFRVAEPRLDLVQAKITDKSSAVVMYMATWPHHVYAMALECVREIRASSRAQLENVALCVRINRQVSTY